MRGRRADGAGRGRRHHRHRRPGRSLELRVAEAELAVRRARHGEPPLPPSTGYLSIYQRDVQPMSTGAVLIKQP